ncbi:MAG: S-layer homology domain-containing protein [Clostridia bacterium]|nr:S-layer homology domain-containing protein [Clostridia bacterium]
MEKRIVLMVCLAVFLIFSDPLRSYARQGDSGYEGGISSGEVPNKTQYDYQEVCFITGEPVLFKGTLSVKKSAKQDSVSSTYIYTLKNADKAATLTRTLSYTTKLADKDNKQTVEETALAGKAVESIKIGSTTYTLTNYDFTRSNLVDHKSAIDYFAGNTWGKKVYQIGASGGGTANGGTVTVEITGNFYGYNQYWGTTEAQALTYIINSEKKNGDKTDKWGGTVDVNLSSNTEKQIKYVENLPDEISFKGGYVETQYNNSVLEYKSNLPEFDKNGTATDRMVETKNSMKLETFPVWKRLPVPHLEHLRGHWAEKDIKSLYSLEVLKGNDSIFKPEEYMTRAEYAKAIVNAAKEVPADPALASKTAAKRTAASNSAKKETAPTFKDVSTENLYYDNIEIAFKRGLINGVGNNLFEPDRALNVADAVTILVRALGLENLAPNPKPVTTFRDNDKIPLYARNAVFVAEKIGLIQGDDKGYLKPMDKLTKARAAALINRFIQYMRDGIRKDYKDGIVNY